MQEKKSIWQNIKETIQVVVVSLIIVIPIRMYIAQPFVVSGQSMDNTFKDGQYLIVDEISYRFEEPKRGDVIVFRVPESVIDEAGQKISGKLFFIKRIIGLPNETVEIINNKVKIYNSENPNGFMIENENYVNTDKLSPERIYNLKTTLGENEYFVMGDNRNNSSDSRYWGPLDRKYIKGTPIFRLHPLSLNPGAILENQYEK